MPAKGAMTRWPRRPLHVDLTLVFGLCAALGWAAVVMARMPGTVAVIWLANGVAMALMLSAPRERTLVLLAAAAAGNLVANLAYGDSVRLSLAFVPPNIVEIAAGVWLVRRIGLAERFSEDHRALLRVLVGAVLVPPLLGATFGAATLQALEFARFTRVWVDWYIGDVLGALATVPLTLALRGVDGRAAIGRLVAAGGLATLTVVAMGTVAAVHGLPEPFVAIAVMLVVVAFVRPRVETFASVAIVVCALAVLQATGALRSPDTPVAHALLFLGALLAVLPAQVVAVVVARQRALSQTLAAVGSRVDDIVTFTDLDGALCWVNQAREIYWGVPNSDVIGRVPDETLPREFRETVFKPMFDQAVRGQVVRRRIEMDYPARGPRTMDISMQPAHDEDGHLIGVLSCASDITELEASRRELSHAAEALRASHENLEQFVRIASHDLREPLNTITQFCGLIEQQQAARLDQTGALYFAQVRTGALRMKQMLDDVLQFVRLEQGPAQAMQPVDLDEVLAEVRQNLYARIHEHGACIEVRPLGTVAGHRSLLALLLQNLVANALKFVPPGQTPNVRVSAEREGGTLRLQVEDNGIGIEPARIVELGTPFRRLHARRKYDGTGLGLAICKRIAEQHAGTIEIRSEVGAGSAFTLVMPGG